MLLHIPQVLTQEQVVQCRSALEKADWIDGRATAGHRSAQVKDNMQIAEGSPLAQKLGGIILDALNRSPLFMMAALPSKIVPPLFNRYTGGQNYGSHVDGAIYPILGTPHRVRTDLSATLFLTPPEDYEGGELTVADTYGGHKVKLPAGDMVLYPGTSLHHVMPVTKGVRISSFMWIESMVRDDGERTLLFDLDRSIQQLNATVPGNPDVLRLLGVYHNLLRRWADV